VRRRGGAAALAGVVLALAGCGSSSEDDDGGRQAARDVRATVLTFIDTLRGGDAQRACAQVPDAMLRTTLREAALGNFRVTPGGSLAERERQVRAAHARAATCTGWMTLLIAEAKPDLDEVHRAAESAPVRWIGPRSAHIGALGDQDWVVEQHDGTWRVTVANVLP
jgi:hypothetical protein